MSRIAQDIQKELLRFVKGGYDVVLPNFFFGYNECDVFRINKSDFVIEYEIKISRADFFADFKKTGLTDNKHEKLKTGIGNYCPNRFFFVMPAGLVDISEIPSYAGLITYDGKWLTIIKSGKLLHKNKFKDFRSICHTLAGRDEGHRIKIKQLSNFDYDKKIRELERTILSIEKRSKEERNENFILRSQIRKETIKT